MYTVALEWLLHPPTQEYTTFTKKSKCLGNLGSISLTVLRLARSFTPNAECREKASQKLAYSASSSA